MAQVLTAPVLVAALVLCVAGAAKLRQPGAASEALVTVGLPGGDAIVRLLGAAEIVVGLVCLASGGRPAPVILGAMYAGFAFVAIRLRRRHQPCGCFGEREAPSSGAQAALSVAFAATAVPAIAWPVHSVGWIFSHPAGITAAIVVGLAGAAYAAVLAYTELPGAWNAWERP